VELGKRVIFLGLRRFRVAGEAVVAIIFAHASDAYKIPDGHIG
jgi:hypothetical protein